MLDEIREIQEYMYMPSEDREQPGRIKRIIFCHAGNLNGIERIMTMIARYFLFIDNENTDNCIRRAEAALRMWTGNTPLDYVEYRKNKTYDLEKEAELAPEYEYLAFNYPWLNWWLPVYLRMDTKGVDVTKPENIEKSIKQLQNKKSQFGRKVFSKSFGSNDYKRISYEKVIANAFSARGPLKRYYLVCTDPEWDRYLHRKSGKKISKHPNDHDKILKTMGAYMIERSRKYRQDNKSRFEPVNYTDIAFWTEAQKKIDKSFYENYLVEDRPLFKCIIGASGNQSKIKPDEEWYEQSGWSLIDATIDDSDLDRFLRENPEAVFYSDNGSGTPLSKCRRYIRY